MPKDDTRKGQIAETDQKGQKICRTSEKREYRLMRKHLGKDKELKQIRVDRRDAEFQRRQNTGQKRTHLGKYKELKHFREDIKDEAQKKTEYKPKEETLRKRADSHQRG